MGQILIIDDNVPLRVLYSINLLVYLDIDTIGKLDAIRAKELLDHHEHIDLVIVKDQVKEDRTALKIYKYLQEKGRTTPMIVLGEEPLLQNYCVLIKDPRKIQNVIQATSTILCQKMRNFESEGRENFIGLPIHYFLIFEELICSVYIRLKGEEGIRHVARFSSGDYINFYEIQKYVKKGVKKLYIKREDIEIFTKHIYKSFVLKMEDNKISLDERMMANNMACEFIQREILSSGLSLEVVSLVSKSIESFKTVVKEIPNLRKLAQDLFKHKYSFKYRHSQLLMYICFHVIENLDWGAEEHYVKLSYMSLLHDICLESDHLVKICNAEKFYQIEMSESDRKQIKFHALKASELIVESSRLPFGLDVLIKQHHGTFNGIGLVSNKYSSHLSPLAQVFIVAEEFVHFMLDNKGQEISGGEIVREISKKFIGRSFLLILQTLQNLKL